MAPAQKKLLLILAAGAAIATILFGKIAYDLRGGALRLRVVAALADALNCDVALETLDVQLMPRIMVIGRHLSVRLKGRPDLPPFAEASQFTVQLGLLSMWRRHVDTVDIDGLVLNVPKKLSDIVAAAEKPAQAAAPQAATAPPPQHALFSVNHLIAHDGTLNFVGREPNNRPLRFAVHELDVADPGVERVMRFTSHVTNPFPEGLVAIGGTFGPWNRDDPPQTALGGTYALPVGDLSSIAGLAGHVTSTGTFSGQLTEIKVNGSSSTSDFSLELGGKPVALRTTFDVTIDGTNGTTTLDRVDAVLINTPIHFTGAIINPKGPGHDVKVAAEVKDGRIEDVLPLVINSDRPILIGGVSLKGTVWLPPGNGDSINRMKVDGAFKVRQARFTDALMQTTLRELSQRAKGKGDEKTTAPIPIDVTGVVALNHGVVTMTQVAATVPGAEFKLSGTYVVGPEVVDFTGTARLDASLSQVVGGFKGLLIKPLNWLFSDHGKGAIIPLEITGTRPDPKIAVRKGQLFKKEK